MRKPKKPDHISQKNWDDVDSPPLTDSELANLRPLREVHPDLADWSEKRKRGQRGPQKEPVKVPVKLRLEPEVLQAYKATGRGWQTRMNDTLRQHAPKE